MEPMKNLCGLIPESLHKRLMEGKDPEMTNGEYLTKVLTAYHSEAGTAYSGRPDLRGHVSAAEVLPGCSFAPHTKSPCPEPSESGIGPVGAGRGTAPGCDPSGQ